MQKLLFVLLLFSHLLGAAADKGSVRLTFHRTGTDAGSVEVSVTNADGNTLTGVTATLVSTSFNALKTSGAAAITNGSVLAPDSYANAEGSQITFLFRIDGLSDDFIYDAADIDVYALTAGGTAQSNSGNTVRTFRFAVATGSTSETQTFAQKNVDTDICTVPDKSNELYHSIQTLSADASAKATNPLSVQVILTKTASLGCYAGIGMLTLYEKDNGGGVEPVDDASFSPDKFYTIHRNNNTSAYMYQNSNTMGAAQLDNTKKFWWVLEPTGNKDCYYIKNATTGKYVQSSVQTLSSLVPMGSEPVEFQIKKDETPGATTKGFYYMASTDQTISVATDASLGLNFGATGIVAYYIKSGRGNSYWQIEESKYTYEPPMVEVTDYARAMQIYSISCGSAGKAYLTSLDVVGDDVLSEVHYAASAAPSNYYTLYVAQKATVRQGGRLPINVSVANGGDAIQTFAYADWDKDGVFEEHLEMTGHDATFQIPSSAATGSCRLRIRVTETGTEGAEDDVIGACYDFIVNVVSAEEILTWSVEVNDSTRGEAKASETNGILQLEALPHGDANFVGWKLMHGYFTGEYISNEAEFEYPLTQNARIVAVFSPNTQTQPDAIIHVGSGEKAETSRFYDLAGRRSTTVSRGIVIMKGKKRISK